MLTFILDPKSLHLKREPWLLDFDQESHTYAVFDETVAKLNEKAEQAQVAPVDNAGLDKTTALPRVVETELMGTA